MNSQLKTLMVIGCAVLLLITLLIWRLVSNARASRRHPRMGALVVDMTTVKIQPMPLTLQAVGQVQPAHSVQVRPQVSGMLKHVFFIEGQYVSAGQRLFLIDPAPYEAALASAKAAAENADANAQRLAPLAKLDYATQQELDNAQATADQADATYQQAKINLSYTDMRAPISGRTGSLSVKSGNIVSPNDSTPLVVINQMQPIQVQYNLAQQFLPKIRRYQARHSIKVVITREDGSGDLDKGSLIFIDNSINTSTGTVMLKASLPNRREQLWPGQYVGVNTELTIQAKAVVVPDNAVQSGQNGNFVYLVKGGKAVIAPVTVDRQVGDKAVISAGLHLGETVITRVPRTLRPGVSVTANKSPVPGITATGTTVP